LKEQPLTICRLWITAIKKEKLNVAEMKLWRKLLSEMWLSHGEILRDSQEWYVTRARYALKRGKFKAQQKMAAMLTCMNFSAPQL